jgi:hypothetical protein
MRAEEIKRQYAAQLDQLLTEAEFAMQVALGIDPLNPDDASAYQLGELAGYLHRITRPARQIERRLDEAAAEAEQDERV